MGVEVQAGTPELAHLQFGVGFGILDQKNFERAVHGCGCYAPRFQFTALRWRPEQKRAPATLHGFRRNSRLRFHISIAAV
jgi:hypothetical protein